MVPTEELKQIALLKDLSEEVLEKIGAVAELADFAQETVLFQENQKLKTFYMLLKGRVLLRCTSSAGAVLPLGEVLPGSSFGVSSFIPGTRSSATAVCTEPCRVIGLSGEKLTAVFQADPGLGYTIMLRVVQLFKSRMNQRTEQFLGSLTRHPDIKSALQ